MYCTPPRRSRSGASPRRSSKSNLSGSASSGPSNSVRSERNNMAERDYIENSGNVFADLEFPNADEILGVDQPKVSALMRGWLAGFSIERLLRFLLLLGTDVAITVKPREHARSRSCGHATGRATKSPHKRILTVSILCRSMHPKTTRKTSQCSMTSTRSISFC
jgi:hypothetical protein